MKKKSLDVLYVEDDATDVDIVKAAVADADGRMKLTVVEDGEKAVEYIRPDGPSARAAVPDLVLLDLNLPKVDGRDVLKEMRASPAYKNVPLIVLSTSSAQEDIDLTYRLGATAYVVKPTTFVEYQETFQALIDFWEKKVDFPSKTEGGDGKIGRH